MSLPKLLLLILTLLPNSVRAAGDGEVLFIGSSTMELWQSYLPRHFPGRNVIDLGVGNTQYTFLAENAGKWVKQYPKARQIVIYSGDNDLTWANKSPGQVAQDFETAVTMLQKGLKNVELHVLSTKPSLEPSRAAKLPVIDQFNDLLEKKAGALGVHYHEVNIPMRGEDGKPIKELFGPDQVHMFDPGYDMWRNLLGPMIAKCVDEAKGSAQIEANLPLMYRLHKKTAMVSGTPNQARSLLRRIRGEVKKACFAQEAVAREVETTAKAILPDTNAGAGAFQAAMKLVTDTQHKINQQRTQIQQSYLKTSGSLKSFGMQSMSKAAAAAVGEKEKEKGEQLVREAKGGRRLASSSARRMLSVDQDLSVMSDELANVGKKYLESWAKLDGGAEFKKARETMAAMEKRGTDLDASRKMLMR